MTLYSCCVSDDTGGQSVLAEISNFQPQSEEKQMISLWRVHSLPVSRQPLYIANKAEEVNDTRGDRRRYEYRCVASDCCSLVKSE